VRWREPGKPLLILDFDIETRKIGFHEGGRYKPDGCEPVIVAAAFNDDDPSVWGMGETWRITKYKGMVRRFRDAYEEADIVTGHYIRKFDLPIMNWAMLECGLPPLPPRRVIDTKTDLVTGAGMSASQENLGALRALEESKFHMNDVRWRMVGRLTPEGLSLARKRVRDDVVQHRALRKSLAGWLRPPSVWNPDR
jgi:hypothetical protein